MLYSNVLCLCNVVHKLCYKLWSRKCISCFDSKVTNSIFLESIQNFSMFLPQKIAPLETEISPQFSLVTISPSQRIKLPPLKTTGLGWRFKVKVSI